ncbi:hypothetical protein C5167_050704 [Papaver somniferum]|uniref:gibberellin 3beta-dioxygenase n=1 Tax=Papaver somniferum TaxID=3469 RepID=A0A4Y7KS85_PAPSO|nr:gibberellin 3-beta-dioxygenase 1-like [Papaver somniferum]RZC75220.1 hypothetical protein C5167_050704 [Papaver somniferum]
MKSISEAYKDHPINLHNIIPIDFKKVHELPDSHTWPSLGQDSISDTSHDQVIPIIDIEDPNIVKLIGHACETWGAFQITNHGISISFLDEVESQSRNLFTQPSQQKLKALRTPDSVGGYGRPRMQPFFPKFLWQEGFTVVDQSATVDQTSKIWPNGDHTPFCHVMEEHQKKSKDLANRLLGLMLDSLEITKDDLRITLLGSSSSPEDLKSEAPHTALQLNSYPACPDPNKAMGLASHTDTSLFTILYQSSRSRGLQIKVDGFGWVTVPPVPGAFVVNIGDLLDILTNGRFPSAVHRAIVNQSHHRISIGYFYGPPCNSKIAPIPKLVDSNHPIRYRDMTWREYIGIKAKHFEKSLSFAAVNPEIRTNAQS